MPPRFMAYVIGSLQRSLTKIGCFGGGAYPKATLFCAPPTGGRMASIGCFEEGAKN